ncbi:hypothetical protein KKF81_02260 [Candidatus Micrarchaeota archaeon]|nr:hypothetical protein [Candidatus Micrarchaeota archaeon]MBU1165743.1 hypothetical protein [Candidatus Micrarchaeota archaeon]MBU1887496.1 hypothetical protein [Candidatus Micrarchaeota archaeon]
MITKYKTETQNRKLGTGNILPYAGKLETRNWQLKTGNQYQYPSYGGDVLELW